MKKILKLVVVVVLSLVATYFLLTFIDKPLFNFNVFDKEIMNFYLNYQSSTIIVSLSFLMILYFLAGKVKLSYLNITRIDGEVKPEPWIGLKPKAHEGWKVIGLNFAIIIGLVTAIVVYFQVSGKGIQVRLWPDIPMVLIFALMNSFTEEVIYRLSFATIVTNEKLSPVIALVLGTLVFGVVHYFGIAPNGIYGALMSGFLGWFLTKSILETKGFFWAWTIHFIQDVIIIFLLFSAV